MQTLITGGTGFVARHLTLRLLAAGHAVRATYRGELPTHTDQRIDWVRIDDVGPDTDWTRALVNVDVVFHLAGLAHRIGASQRELADEYERVNAQGTQRLAASLVARGGRARLVLMSSIGAVCTTSVAPVSETTLPQPDSLYGKSKLHAEQLLELTCGGTAVEWCALRAPLVYGPRAPGNMARLIGVVARGVPLPLGCARAQRSLLFVDNLADALLAAALSPGVASQRLLVADDETVSVAGLVRLLGELSGRGARLVPVPGALMKVAAILLDALRGRSRDRNDALVKSVELLFGGLVLDTRASCERLAWRPPYRLREGLALTLRAAANGAGALP
jgi:nucleoside-diphosphate-sugar epimerase